MGRYHDGDFIRTCGQASYFPAMLDRFLAVNLDLDCCMDVIVVIVYDHLLTVR